MLLLLQYSFVKIEKAAKAILIKKIIYSVCFTYRLYLRMTLQPNLFNLILISLVEIIFHQ